MSTSPPPGDNHPGDNRLPRDNRVRGDNRARGDNQRGQDSTDPWLLAASRELGSAESSDELNRIIASLSPKLAQVRHSGRELATSQRQITVHDRVVRRLLAVRIREGLGRLVVFAEIDGERDVVTGVRLGLIAHYRDDLHADAQAARNVAAEVLQQTLGAEASETARSKISVRWQDLYTRQWTT